MLQAFLCWPVARAETKEGPSSAKSTQDRGGVPEATQGRLELDESCATASWGVNNNLP